MFKRILFFSKKGTINGDADPVAVEPTKKSRKPANTAFRQQRLKAWQPILSPQSVLPLLILVACIFSPIGIGLIVSATNVQNFVLDYSYCGSEASTNSFTEVPSKYVRCHFKKSLSVKPSWKLREGNDGEDTCELKFEIPNTIKKSVFIYYKLTNFYQNHRKYVDSFDINQINGEAVRAEDLDSSCNPLRVADEKAVYPCGLIANSIFNDTFSSFLGGSNGVKDYILTDKDISWSSDRKRFKKTTYNASQIIPPPNWAKKYPNGYTDDNIPDLHTWEELQVWMRTAALPNFYKLALKNQTAELPSGNYSMNITLNYPVSSFGGRKSFVLTTSGTIGGRNMSLGVIYCIVAGISALFAIVFLLKVIIQPRAMGDHSYLNFENTPETQDPSSSQRNTLREML